MRAILIDPENQILTEIQLGEDYRELNKAIGCRDFTTGAFLNGSLAAGFDSILVSDDCLEDDDDPRFWFQVDADRKPPSSHPIPGRGVALGAGAEGESCDVRISVDELRARVTFTQRKFRGFETFTGAQARARGADLVAEMKAPDPECPLCRGEGFTRIVGDGIDCTGRCECTNWSLYAVLRRPKVWTMKEALERVESETPESFSGE